MEEVGTFEDVLNIVGPFGTFQVLIFILTAVTSYTSVEAIWVNFTAYVGAHWCHVDNTANLPFENQKDIAIPSSGDGYSQCTMFDLNYTSYTVHDFLNLNRSAVNTNRTPVIPCNNGWVYDKSLFVRTVAMDFDLVCDKRWTVDFISTVFLGGSLFGAFTAGILADKYGRRLTLLICTLVKLVGNVLSIIPNYYAYMIGRFIAGGGSVSTYQVSTVILAECTGSKYRNIVGLGYGVIYSFGFMTIPIVAYFIRDYLMLQIALTVPMFLMLSYYFLIPESPRWLLLQNRITECHKVLEHIAHINKREYPESLDLTNIEITAETKQEASILLDLFRTPKLRRRTLILFAAFFTVSLIFFALSLNAGNLAGDLFLNTFLLGLVEIPANLIMMFIINRPTTGRRFSHMIALLLAGCGCLSVVPILLWAPSLVDLATAFSLLGKAGSTGAFNGLYLYAAELFPTQLRNIGVGAANTMSRLGAMISPYFGGYLYDVWNPLPSLIFGILGITLALSMLLLPETLGRKLPQLVSDVEHSDSHGFTPSDLINSQTSLTQDGASKKYGTLTDGSISGDTKTDDDTTCLI